jgi:hypothetical protein
VKAKALLRYLQLARRSHAEKICNVHVEHEFQQAVCSPDDTNSSGSELAKRSSIPDSAGFRIWQITGILLLAAEVSGHFFLPKPVTNVKKH